MKLGQAIYRFLDRGKYTKNYSENTLNQYQTHLEKFLGHLGNEYDLETVTHDDVYDFRISLAKFSKKPLGIKTVNAYMITLRNFFLYCEKHDFPWISSNKIELMKSEQRKVDFLTGQELQMLLESFWDTELRERRDRAIIKMIATTGLRISELTKLNRSDIESIDDEFSIRGKGNKVRPIFLSEGTKNTLLHYLEGRTDSFSPLFIRHNYDSNNQNILQDEAMRLTRIFITDMIRRRSLAARIPKKVSAHTLRHTFATTLLWHWADLRSIQEFLGHANIQTTQVYTHVMNPELKKLHKKLIE